MKFLVIFTFFYFVSFTTFALEASFSAQEKEELLSGKQLVTQIENKESSWPTIRLYQVIEASALESVAIFYALDYQKKYVPNVIQSDIAKVVSPTEIWVQYELEMPWPLSNSRYLHSHTLKKIGDDRYRVTWKMQESDSTEKVDGLAEFYPFSEGKTLMVYQNAVIPKSVFATFVKGTMVSDVEKSLAAIREQIHLCRNTKKDILKIYIQKIKLALEGKNPYEIKKKQ